MIFNRRSDLAGKHAFLSPSNYHWIRYDDQKLAARYVAAMAARRGTDLHLFAHEAIRLGIKMPKTKTTLNMYVNDAIGFKMEPEVCLYYSENCFGHADTISFRNNRLRIHDLKTGITHASHEQLEVYAALFCLEYAISPEEIDIDLRMYQRDEINTYSPDPETIEYIMDKIVAFDLAIEAMKQDM